MGIIRLESLLFSRGVDSNKCLFSTSYSPTQQAWPAAPARGLTHSPCQIHSLCCGWKQISQICFVSFFLVSSFLKRNNKDVILVYFKAGSSYFFNFVLKVWPARTLKRVYCVLRTKLKGDQGKAAKLEIFNHRSFQPLLWCCVKIKKINKKNTHAFLRLLLQLKYSTTLLMWSEAIY